jgi:hypothetical protein
MTAIDTTLERIHQMNSDPAPFLLDNKLYDVNALLTKVNNVSRELRANNVVIHGIPHDAEHLSPDP